MYREDVILPLVKEKCVLDCGGVDHCFVEHKRDEGSWLHDQIRSRAKECVGVDILEDRVDQLNSIDGYKFLVANVEELDFHEQFDVVVAGELIEHIYNAGLFLDGAWRALKDNGTLVVTTPNFQAFSRMVYMVVRGKEVCHEEHTCYYSRQTLSYLVERHGFEIKEFHVLGRPAQTRLRTWIRSAVHAVRPQLGEQLVMVAEKKSKQSKYSDKW
ncbi:MAG: class I SAM-dependent methyltransferase [Pirellulales bacterium]|nr:class I SAM-dependent methyltransferase [Pirellulales bacterium]